MGLDLEALYREALRRLSAEELTARALAGRGLGGGVRLLGLGKAACGMARGAATALGEVRGLVASNLASPLPKDVRFLQGSHPVPDERSERAGRALLAEAGSLAPDETAIFLVSGGGSAIAAAPSSGLSLEEKIGATRALLLGGTSIEETNAVRKHLSAIKGGQLAAAARGSRRIALVLCDVTSGDLASVASGPCTGDPTTFADCLRILERRQVSLPLRAREHLEAGARQQLAETPKPDDPRLASVEQVLLAAPFDLARVAQEISLESGEPCAIEERAFVGRVEEVAEHIVRRVREASGPGLFAFAGEPTVRVPPDSGSGGRMQHLALLLARSLAGADFEALCAGSDGRDGDTPHAGARVDGRTAGRAGAQLDLPIARFDSATTCAALGLALPAFDSGTNLCDLVLVRKSSAGRL